MRQVFKTEKGYRVRVRALDPRTDTLKERNKEFAGINLEQALQLQLTLRAEIRDAVKTAVSRTRYGDYVTLLLKSKTARGELSTAKGRRTWSDAQTLHLVPYFGDWYLDASSAAISRSGRLSSPRRFAMGSSARTR